MYHHVNSDRCSNKYDIFQKHLEYISKKFTSTFPTDKLPENPICLVFDDGYYDFYEYIFPLLKKYNLKALLAVVPEVILESCDKPKEMRLNYEHNDLFKEYKNGTFCTFEELKEMTDSGLVEIASHSFSHKNLLEEDADLTLEIEKSKEILEQKLDIKIDSFVYPFGKYNQNILDQVNKYYKYSFRIGNGLNIDFSGINGVIYRIDGDNLKRADEIFKTSNMLKYGLKSFIKMLVGNR